MKYILLLILLIQIPIYGNTEKIFQDMNSKIQEKYIQKQILDFKNKAENIKTDSHNFKKTSGKKYKFKEINVIGLLDYKYEFNLLKSTYRDKELSLTDIKELEIIFTDFFKKKGYLLTRVEFLDGDINNGILNYKIINNKVKEVNIYNGTNKSQFKSKFNSLIKLNHSFNIFDLDQTLENLNIENINYHTQIQQLENDEYIINIVGEKNNLITGVFGIDNNSYKDLGEYQWNSFVSVNDLLNLSEHWYFTTVDRITKDRKKNVENVIKTGIEFPYKYFKFGYSLEYGYTKNKISTSINKYKLTNEILGQKFYLKKNLWRNQKNKVFLVSAINIRNYKSQINNLTLDINSKKYTNATLGIEMLNYFQRGILYSLIEYERGTPWFQSEGNTELNKKSGYNLEYNKINFLFNWQRQLKINNYDFNYNLKSGGIYTDERLLTINQFSMGDKYSVRGFKETSVYGNKAIYLNNTLTYFPKKKNKNINVYPFIGLDFGVSEDKDLNDIDKISGATLGLDFSISNNIFGSLSYAAPLSVPVGLPREKNIVYLNFSYLF